MARAPWDKGGTSLSRHRKTGIIQRRAVASLYLAWRQKTAGWNRLGRGLAVQ